MSEDKRQIALLDGFDRVARVAVGDEPGYLAKLIEEYRAQLVRYLLQEADH